MLEYGGRPVNLCIHGCDSCLGYHWLTTALERSWMHSSTERRSGVNELEEVATVGRNRSTGRPIDSTCAAVSQQRPHRRDVEVTIVSSPPPTFSAIIVMGVSGSGKTTVGTALASELGWDFIDGDSFHSQESRHKIATGIPLTDDDREPWLARLSAVLAAPHRRDPGLVLACSALRKRYRDVLRRADPEAAFVYLAGATDLIAGRLCARSGHFAPAAILTSQMATLEEPEHALTVDIEPDVATIVATIRNELGV